MNRKLLAVAFIAGTSLAAGACSAKDQTFEVRNGLCYRVTVNKTAGCTTNTEKVKALNENCGLPPRTS